MSRKKLTVKMLDEIERKAKARTSTVESLIIGLVDRHLDVSRIVKLVGREVVDVEGEPRILMPEIFGDYLYPAMVKVARGGRGSAKTQSFIRIILARMQATRTHVGCFREIQKSINDSVKQTIEEIIEQLGLRDEFYITDKEISHLATGSKMVFAGLYRNVNSIKGMDWIDIAFCEEAENISEESWNILCPTLRKDGAELMVCYNPKNVLDATHVRYGPGACPAYIEDDETGERIRYSITKQINYSDNPFFTKNSRAQMMEMKREDHELYLHIWEGQPNADSEQSIIKPSWIQASIDAHIKLGFEPSGRRAIGQDVADETINRDTSALCDMHGSVVMNIEEWSGHDTDYTGSRAYQYAGSVQATALIYDSIGVGAGVKSCLNRLRAADLEEYGYENDSFTIHGFNAGGAVFKKNQNYTTGKKNGEMFENIKAQAWWLLRDRFYKTFKAVSEGESYDGRYDPSELISISSGIKLKDQLAAELSRPRVAFSKTGKTMVESKQDMAKRQIKSPNLADALVMCVAPVKGDLSGALSG